MSTECPPSRRQTRTDLSRNIEVKEATLEFVFAIFHVLALEKGDKHVSKIATLSLLHPLWPKLLATLASLWLHTAKDMSMRLCIVLQV